MTRNDEVPQEVGEALRDRLLMEAVQWDDWNRDHPGDQALTTPPLLRDAADAITTLRAKLEAAEGEVARLRDSNEKLLGFVNEVMPLDEEWIGDVDGGTMQDAAEKHGLLAPHEVTEPCGDGCNCASYGDFPQTCYRPTGVLRPADAALQEHTP